MRLPLDISPGVADALAAGGPVVALETTIVTHGMPAPENLATAAAVEADIRAEGAIPAAIAVIDGRLKVGLSEAEMADLAARREVAKLSRADIAACMARDGTGSTTVAATMIAARAAGIEVFATGGIGGVHRGAELSFDVSADLTELAQTPVTVVSAGPKAILDIPATLEVLETLGVPVFAWGQDEVPAFWSRSSGLRAPLRADRESEIARSARMRAALGLPGGQLVTNPIPAEHEITAARLAPVIEAALREAEQKSVTGKEVTPFLLDRVLAATKGESLVANIALVRNNARLAARIALEFSKLPAVG